MEQVLQPLEEIEEPRPAQLLAEADVACPFEPHPGRGLGRITPADPRRQLRDLALPGLAHLRVDPGRLGGMQVPQAAEHGEAFEAGEVLHQLAVERRDGIGEEIAVRVGELQRPGHDSPDDTRNILASGRRPGAARAFLGHREPDDLAEVGVPAEPLPLLLDAGRDLLGMKGPGLEPAVGGRDAGQEHAAVQEPVEDLEDAPEIDRAAGGQPQLRDGEPETRIVIGAVVEDQLPIGIVAHRSLLKLPWP